MRALLPALQDFGRTEGLRAFPVTGDLMEPTVRRGDFALVHPVDRYIGEGIYVIGESDPSIYRVEVVMAQGVPAACFA